MAVDEGGLVPRAQSKERRTKHGCFPSTLRPIFLLFHFLPFAFTRDLSARFREQLGQRFYHGLNQQPITINFQLGSPIRRSGPLPHTSFNRCKRNTTQSMRWPVKLNPANLFVRRPLSCVRC